MSLPDNRNATEIKDCMIEKRRVALPDGISLPCLGQGTWYMGEDPDAGAKEIKALQLGVELDYRITYSIIVVKKLKTKRNYR